MASDANGRRRPFSEYVYHISLFQKVTHASAFAVKEEIHDENAFGYTIGVFV